MSIGIGYLLDTNIIVALMRMNLLGTYIEATYGLRASLSRSLISVVTAGEMLSLGRKFGWGKTKLDALEAMLHQLLRRVEARDPDILLGTPLSPGLRREPPSHHKKCRLDAVAVEHVDQPRPPMLPLRAK